MKNEDLIKLESPDFHESIGIFPRWRIGDKNGQFNEIYPYYDADQCEKILDEVLGVDGWGNEYREVAGMLICTISINTENGIFEKSDTGGIRPNKKKKPSYVSEEDWELTKKGYAEMTRASWAFVRACARLGIGRHLNDLPKIRLTVQSGVAVTPKGERLATPEELSAWCNQTSPAIMHLASAYRMCKSTFENNPEATEMFSKLKQIIEGGQNNG